MSMVSTTYYSEPIIDTTPNNFKMGDRVICINNDHGTKPLTINKIYTVISLSGLFDSKIRIMTDNGRTGNYFSWRFKLAPPLTTIPDNIYDVEVMTPQGVKRFMIQIDIPTKGWIA